jgi:hypothetical protein
LTSLLAAMAGALWTMPTLHQVEMKKKWEEGRWSQIFMAPPLRWLRR